jgi:Ankyrin repeat
MHFLPSRKPNLLMETICNQDWEKVISLCQTPPHQATRLAKQWCRIKLAGDRDSIVLLPLHYIVLMEDDDGNHSKEYLRAVSALIREYPHALECKESSLKRTPLHLACQQQHGGAPACDNLISLLVQAYPDAAKERDHYLRLPLHYACANINIIGGFGGNGRALEALLEAYPEAASRRDGQGWLPIHVACHYKSDVATIQRLLQVYPDSVIAFTPLDRERPYDLVRKQGGELFRDKYAIMDLLEEKEQYYVPTPTPIMDSFLTDNFIHPIY